MKRTVFATLVLALLGAACGGGSEEAAGADLLTSDVPRSPVGDTAQLEAAVATTNGVGADLYRRFATDRPDANLVLSPTSIATALAMVRAGARGATAEEMDRMLSVTDPDGLHRGMNALDQALAARSRTVQLGDGSPAQVSLESANSVWGQRDLGYEQAFLDTLASQYGAGLRVVDFEEDPEAARQAINDWVATETKDRIPELLPEGSIDTLTRLALVNAVYLKAPWLFPFDADATSPGPFTKLDGTTVDVPMMRLFELLPYAKGEGWQAVSLPYAGGDLSMLVVVPDTLPAFETTLTADRVAEIVGALSTGLQVNLQLPSWDTESALSLKDALAALGMPTAFTDAADFSGMTTEEALRIAEVIHQANITVDEEGTEAAAATAAIMRATSAPFETVDLTVDRPFVFALLDNETGAVLFLGRVVDPA